MARGLFWLLSGAMVAACALPDVSIVSSFDQGGAAGRGGATAAGNGGTAGRGGSSGKGAGGTGGSSTSGDAGEAGDGTSAGGVGGQTGGTGGDAGRGGTGRAGGGASSGGASAGTAAGGASGDAGSGGTSGGGATSGGASGAGAGGVSGTGGSSSSTCGDGTGEPPEACDDGNSFACGTCSADCLTATPLAPARGTIHVALGAVQDGEKFTLDDGFGGVDFEFDNNNMWDTTIPAIFFNATTDADLYRDRIIAAVNEGANGLAITAEPGPNPGEVLLTNDNPGIGGNRPITDQVSGSGFTHTGMSGGAGADCPLGTGCISDTVCAAMHCVDGFCAPP